MSIKTFDLVGAVHGREYTEFGEYASADDYRELDRENQRLESFKTAYMEWSDKTDWVQTSATSKELGKHRADVIKDRFEAMREDANRFRWLRNNGYDIGSYHEKHEYNAAAWFEHLDDAAIDAAIADDQQFSREQLTVNS